MSQIFFQLGSFPALSLYEIEKTFPYAKKTEWLKTGSVFEGIRKQELKKNFPLLGGSIRAGEIITESKEIEDLLIESFHQIEKISTEGKKTKIGISVFPSSLQKKYFGLFFKAIKNLAKEKNISLRIVNRNQQGLDAGTVTKENLLTETNLELCVFCEQKKFLLGKTLKVQDIEKFALRDTQKPVRDMMVGMIPPKLARMMINFSRDENGELPKKIYDPFCGTGTVLLEGLDMNLKVSGSDISKKMISATEKNTHWYFDILNPKDENDLGIDDKPPLFLNDIFIKDASKPFFSDQSKKMRGSAIVAEGFLGKIFSNPVSENQFFTQKDELFPLYRKFLYEISQQKTKVIVFAFPFWKGKKKSFSFTKKLIDFMEKLGYITEKTLLYQRETQVVGREIVVMRKK